MNKLFDRFAKYLIAAVAIIVPLYPKFPFINLPGTYVAIRFEDILLLLLAIFTLVKIIPNFREVLKDKIVAAFLIFFAVGFISLLSGAFLTQTVALKLGFFHWLRRIEYASTFFAVLYLLKKEQVHQNLEFIVKVLMIVTFVAFIYGIGERYFRFPIIITQNEEYSKGQALFWTAGSQINSTFAGHYDLAAFAVLVLPVFITLSFVLKNFRSQILLWAASFSGLWLLINTFSRTGQISYLLAAGTALLLVRKFRALVIVLLISFIFIAMSGGVEERFQRIFTVFQRKISQEFTVYAEEVTLPAKRASIAPTPAPVLIFEDRSASIRLNIEWPRAIRAFTKNPILGTGYSSINLATDNDYLRALGEVGLLGFFAFIFVFFTIGREILKIFPFQNFPIFEKSFIASIIGGSLGTFLSALFIDLFEASKFATLFWLLLGFAVYTIRSKEYVHKN